MITKKEIQATQLSATKKDFYQIWNELLETAGKISERWDPASTNESDPGIVLLKVLTAIADKLNYNIDKNILEAFMPSAAQEESMRKLCEMLGYNMKYYQSATTDIIIKFIGSWTDDNGNEKYTNGIFIPRFTNIKNEDDDVNYVTLRNFYIKKDDNNEILSIPCIEGQLCSCETNINNIISLTHLDDNFRYYLPETQIAENGIFIRNLDNNILSEEWKKVDNLNTQELKSKVYKFGFDSKARLPYIQFPEDISYLIEDGLYIDYIRTSGANGNISAKTLSKITDFVDDAIKELYGYEFNESDWKVSNPSATKNGTNIETLNQAYNNYKKTIGTFDTLVTCRDYMNKIYQLTTDDSNITPLVSNINVTDIRNDINRSLTLCTFNEHGISYKALAQTAAGKAKISHFDLVLYPFRTIYNITKNDYKKSFTYDTNNYYEIVSDLEDYKTVAHNICLPQANELVCIKNYININAEIITARKINYAEELDILEKVKTAIYTEFNMRNLEFGEELSEEEIIKCIQNADQRIKYVYKTKAFDIYTKFMTANGTEFDAVASDAVAKTILDKLILQNVLAGRVSLFNKQEAFDYSFTEKNIEYYPENSEQLVGIKPKLEIGEGASNLQLKENEVIQFRLPNYKTELTYPAYTNYFAKLNTGELVPAQAASFITLKEFLAKESGNVRYALKAIKNDALRSSETLTITTENYQAVLEKYGYLFEKIGNSYRELITKPTDDTEAYVLTLSNENLVNWNLFLQSKLTDGGLGLAGYCVYDRYDFNLNYPAGYLVDNKGYKFRKATTINKATANTNIKEYFIQEPNYDAVEKTGTEDGLGRNLISKGNLKDAEYQLGRDEFLFVNYTPATKAEDGSSSSGTPVYKFYGKGTIIKANFDLVDSNTLHTGSNKKWAKESVVNAFDCANDEDHRTKYNYADIDRAQKSLINFDNEKSGMFSLGANEQIEIIEPVEVKFQNSCYISWTLNNPEIDIATKTQTIPFTDIFEEVEGKQQLKQSSYILQEGEYLYYTNQNKEDIAIYGCGTEIIRSNTSIRPAINKDTKYSAEDVIEKGLGGVLDWAYQAYNKNTDFLLLKEYKYLNLTNGDILVSANLSSDADTSIITDTITSEWVPCKRAAYISGGVQNELPRITLYSDTSLKENSKMSWEVRSKLCLDFSPEKAQTLRTNSSAKIIDYLELYYAKRPAEAEPIIIQATTVQEEEAETSISIKANYPCNSTVDFVDVSINEYDSDGSITKVINDFKLKTFDIVPVSAADKQSIPFGNFGNGLFTKIDFSKFSLDSSLFVTSIDVEVPEETTGLMAWYYIDGGQERELNVAAENRTEKFYEHAYIKIKDKNAAGDYTYPILYNESQAQNAFIKLKNNKCKFVSEKLAVLKFNANTKYEIEIYSNSTKNNSIFFSGLSLIPKKDGTIINQNLGLSDSNETSVNQLITQLIGNNAFFYNCPIANSTAITLNTTTNTKMTDPHIWYDYNNICNNFVISEIDADHLDKGIIISPTSKL